MKKRQLLALFLALALSLALATTASAAPHSVTISVDGSIVNVEAWLDANDIVRVANFEDLLKVFPTELEDMVIAYDPVAGISVEDYAKKFGYRSSLSYQGNPYGYVLCIFKDTSNIWMYPEVFVNGMRSSHEELLKGDFTNYRLVKSGNRLYLNNDGVTPVEVVLDGKLIDFPDQQPVILQPGRTMIPIRAVSESLGCELGWSKNPLYAVIRRGTDIMYLYPEKTVYQFNGRYYTMDIAPTVRNNRTLVPLRFIAERFGYTADFRSGDVITITLTSNKN